MMDMTHNGIPVKGAQMAEELRDGDEVSASIIKCAGLYYVVLVRMRPVDPKRPSLGHDVRLYVTKDSCPTYEQAAVKSRELHKAICQSNEVEVEEWNLPEEPARGQ